MNKTLFFSLYSEAMLSRRLAAAAGYARLLSASAPAESTGGAGGPSSAGGGDTLGKRLLKLIYPKRSAVVVLRRWAEEGRTVHKYQLNRVVRELRKYRRFKHALEVRARHCQRVAPSSARPPATCLPYCLST